MLGGPVDYMFLILWLSVLQWIVSLKTEQHDSLSPQTAEVTGSAPEVGRAGMVWFPAVRLIMQPHPSAEGWAAALESTAFTGKWETQGHRAAGQVHCINKDEKQSTVVGVWVTVHCKGPQSTGSQLANTFQKHRFCLPFVWSKNCICIYRYIFVFTYICTYIYMHM